MAKGFKDYAGMLKRIKPGKQVQESSPYRWKELSPEEKGKRDVLYGICGSCKNYECLTRVYLEDGIVTRIEGNPQSPLNHGAMCARGNSEVMGLYNPYRVKTPLVRTNPEKGLDIDPMWKEVSWNEALDIVAMRLKQVREKDPRGLVLCEGMGNEESIMRRPFCQAFGTPNLMASRGPLCTIHYASCLVHGSMPSATADVEYCQYFVTLGNTLGPNFAAVGATRRFAQAISRGMKLVVVDPRSSPEASKGEWIPIRPGTDFSFLLALAHVFMHEGLKFDVWFMKNRTNAPYLIGPDGNYYREPATGKPMMWDTAEKRAKTFDSTFQDIALESNCTVNGVDCHTAFALIKEEFAKYTPEWAEKISTIPAETTRRIAREFVDNARIGSTIEIDGFTFPFRPVSLNTRRGVNSHRWGTYADLTGKMINMLVGNIEVPGGVLGDGSRGPILAPDKDGVVKPAGEAVPTPFKLPPDHIDGSELYPNKHTGPHLTAKAILEPEKYYHDYRVEAWMFVGGNPVRKTAQPHIHVEAIKKVPFVVTCAYHMDETAILSDVVLPESCALERYVVTLLNRWQVLNKEVFGLQVAYIRQPVPTIFNTKNQDDIWQELAERLGILHGEGGLYDRFNQSNDCARRPDGLCLDEKNKLDLYNKEYTLEEIFDRELKSWKRGDGRGISELNKEGFFAQRTPEKEFYAYYYHPDNTTRHPFYFQHLKNTGEELRANLEKHNISIPGIDNMDYIFEMYRPIPHWVENSEFRAPEEYDLWVINWRTPYFSSDTNNISGNPWMIEIIENDPFEDGIYMNSATAQRKNLIEGNIVVVESRYGKTRGRLHVTELLHPDAVGIPGCRGLGTLQSNPVLKEGANWNALLPMDEKTLDPVSAGMESSPRVRVYREEEKR